MSELGPSARALLEAARDGMGPDAAAIARMRGKIGATVGGGAVAGGTALALKLLVVGVLVAGAVGIGLYTRGGSSELATVAQVTPVVEPTAMREVEIDPKIEIEPMDPPTSVKTSPATPATTATTSTATTSPTTTPTRTTSPTRTSPASTSPATTTSATTSSPTTTSAASSPTTASTSSASTSAPSASVATTKPAGPGLAREVELIDRAMAAMRRSDPAGALAAVRIHAAETGGRGQLAEDAAAIEIEALCRQRVSVFDKLEAFDARWPTSAQRSRLTNTCR